MGKQKFFLDMLFEVMMELKAPSVKREKKIEILKKFLATLPNIMLAEVDILPPGTYLKGVATICSPEEYLRLSEEERRGKKIDFEFRETDPGVTVADVHKEEFFFYTGMWDEGIERLVDEIAPGDQMLRLGTAKNFFCQN